MERKELEFRLDQLLARAYFEIFEDGRTSYFEDEFRKIFFEEEEETETHKQDVVKLFIEKLKEEKGDVLREALGILARLSDRKVSALYRQCIHEHVYYNDPNVRDGALTAIEYMEHYDSKPVLRAYYDWETVPYLKRYAGEILAYYESYSSV